MKNVLKGVWLLFVLAEVEMTYGSWLLMEVVIGRMLARIMMVLIKDKTFCKIQNTQKIIYNNGYFRNSKKVEW